MRRIIQQKDVCRLAFCARDGYERRLSQMMSYIVKIAVNTSNIIFMDKYNQILTDK